MLILINSVDHAIVLFFSAESNLEKVFDEVQMRPIRPQNAKFYDDRIQTLRNMFYTGNS